MAENLRLLAAKRLLDFVGPEAFPAAATQALVEGVDSPSIRRLAGMDGADAGAIRATFRAALAELAIEMPAQREAAIVVATDIAARIVGGAVPPYQGAKAIWGVARSVWPEDLPELDAFVYAASEWDERPRDRKRFDAGIVAAAHDLVGVPDDPPSSC